MSGNVINTFSWLFPANTMGTFLPILANFKPEVLCCNTFPSQLDIHTAYFFSSLSQYCLAPSHHVPHRIREIKVSARTISNHSEKALCRQWYVYLVYSVSSTSATGAVIYHIARLQISLRIQGFSQHNVGGKWWMGCSLMPMQSTMYIISSLRGVLWTQTKSCCR